MANPIRHPQRQTMAKPEISVIIPAYNGASYICEAIESVLSQTYRHFEVIVVDDGSIDNTKEILEPYIAKASIRYFHQGNAGHGAARNTGIKYAQGKYVCFLDQDDWYERGSLEHRLHLYEKYPELGLVCSDFRNAFMESNKQIVYEESYLKKYNKIGKFPNNSIEIKGEDFCIFNKAIFPELILDCFTWVGTAMIRKEVFDDVGLFPEDLRWSPDYDLLIRIARQYNVGFLNMSTAIYRQHSRNMSLDHIGFLSDNIIVKERYYSNGKIPFPYKFKMRNQLGKLHFSRGYFYIRKENFDLAREDFKSAFLYNPFRPKHVKCLSYCILPLRITKSLRKILHA